MAQTQTDQQAVEQLLEKIDRSWQALQEELAQVRAERKAEPNVVGVWSVKDVVGHIAMWDEVEAQRFEQAMGKPGVVVEDIHWQARNDREAAKRANHSLAALEAEFDQSHEHLLIALRSLADGYPEIATGMLPDLPEMTYEHYDEHRGQIREWRERSDA